METDAPSERSPAPPHAAWPHEGPWVDIDLGGLCANFRLIRNSASTADVAAVVKCDGYGLGAAPIARALARREQCRAFFVAYPHEGAALRAALEDLAPEATIYVFNGPAPDTIDRFKAAALTPVLNSAEQAALWVEASPGAPAALHIDTGMNRLGAPLAEVGAIAAQDGLNIALVMSHLACSSDPADPKNPVQRDLFIEAAKRFPQAKRSLAASGGALMDESYHFDLVRPGVALYGASPFDQDEPRLHPVAALSARIIQIRNAAAGETVGYGATCMLERPSVIATVSLGYGDGFPRAASNRAAALVGGARAPVAGRISMDLITLDATDLPAMPRIGDAAMFFGTGLSIHEAAAACNTISYELLTGLGGRVDRRYL